MSLNDRIDGLAVINLPSGPTSYFRLSSLTLSKDIHGHGKVAAAGEYEVLTKNFNTRIGRAVKGMFESIFPEISNLGVRQVIIFHNQQDYIFFRRCR